MKRQLAAKIHPGQEGSVLVIVLIVLALLTIIGVSATDMSTSEMKISTNDKDYRIAFYHANSGIYSMPKWIRRVAQLDNELPRDINGDGTGVAGTTRFEYLADGDSNLKEEVMGYADTYDPDKDIEFEMENGMEGEVKETSQVSVDLRSLKSRRAHGSSAEFEQGQEASGIRGAYEKPFWINSDADMENGTHTRIIAQYVYMTDTPGGL